MDIDEILSNLPALEIFNSYNPSLNDHNNIANLNLHSSASLPESWQFDGFLGETSTMDVGADLHCGGGHPVCDPQKASSVATERLRRKKISKWFSKLEILLPQDDIPKFDRCSLIDATIRYIRSLQKTISEASHEENKEARASGDIIVKRQKVEACEEGAAALTTKTCVNYAANCDNYIANCEEEGVMISISLSGPEHAFINAITSHTDPVLFSTMLSVLHHHHLQVLNANLTRTGDKVVFSFYAKILNKAKDYNYQCLKDHLSSVFTSLSKG